MARRPLTDELEQEEAPLAGGSNSNGRPQRRNPGSARPEKHERAEHSRRRRARWGYLLLPLVTFAAALAVTWMFHRVKTFLIADTRFHLQRAVEYGATPPSLEIHGLRRSSRPELLRVFEEDLGRSLYLLDAQQRRRQLLALDWIRQAEVRRLWPNRVRIEVVERTPVAFAQINRAGDTPRFFLIDVEGVLLPIPKGESFENFAVLTGLSGAAGKEAEQARAWQVRQALALLSEAAAVGADLSEIDVSDPGNLQATLKVDDGAVALRLGGTEFRRRLNRFLKYYPEIRKHRPGARIFDLRVQDRVIAIEGGEAYGS